MLIEYDLVCSIRCIGQFNCLLNFKSVELNLLLNSPCL